MTRSLLAGLALTAVGFFALASTPVEVGAEGPAASSLQLASGQSAQVLSDEPDSLSATFIGFVHRDAKGHMATRVRAAGQTSRGESVNCGTANVVALDGSLGFYGVLVLGSAAREGCPVAGEQVRFLLLYGSVDDGVFATTMNDARFLPGASSVVSLTPSTQRVLAGWAGDASATSARLTWTGSDGTSIAGALAALDRPVTHAWRWDAAHERFLVYTPGGPAFVQTLLVVDQDDVLSLRFE